MASSDTSGASINAVFRLDKSDTMPTTNGPGARPSRLMPSTAVAVTVVCTAGCVTSITSASAQPPCAAANTAPSTMTHSARLLAGSAKPVASAMPETRA